MQLALDPTGYDVEDVALLLVGQLFTAGDAVPLRQAGPAARGSCVLRDEHRMTAVWRLPAVLARLRGREPFADDVARMLAQRRRRSRLGDDAIRAPQCELRAERLGG